MDRGSSAQHRHQENPYQVRDLDQTDQRLLNELQADFPVEHAPFAALASRLGAPMTEAEVIARIAALRERNVIRQISAIFDTRSLGYQSTLVAMRFAPEKLERGAAVINQHPGVSHNYKRNHEFNLWFTLATPPGSNIDATLQKLHEMSGADVTRKLQTLKLFKIGVKLDMTGELDVTRQEDPDYTGIQRDFALQSPLSERDIAVIRAVQDDLPLVPHPFSECARSQDLSEEELFAGMADLRRRGHLRRVAAILHHRRAGYAANAMAVWAVPEERAEELGRCMAEFASVSHCYQRPVYEDWRFNLFSMIHGRKVGDCEKVVDAIRQAIGVEDYAVLYSTKEYKKTRVRYFTRELEEWEETHLSGAPAAVARA
ncbi:MAG TPA: AsnC family transcriptional regulator [Candidatus Dormibacteraeota bacterium]|jgi:DNA-binding Lrp family transcriptional regulator|nr:AsnC family transcriptional regulator [Candidatus Dormibacteraeota bacterium]